MYRFINQLRLIFGGRKMEERYSIGDIAKYFLSKSSMTPKKLQKILYFSYSWYLAIMNDNKEHLTIKLFENNFEAWIHGPVDSSIYSEYKKYGADRIPKLDGITNNIQEEDMEILDEVWDVYGKYTANQLESISHQHDPWRITRETNDCSSFDWCNASIPDDIIFNYYTKQLVNNN